MVTQTLDQHFAKKLSFWEIDEKFEKIMRFIDPNYLEDFKAFRKKVIWVLLVNPEEEKSIVDNLDLWIEEFAKLDRKYASINSSATKIVIEWDLESKTKSYNKWRKR